MLEADAGGNLLQFGDCNSTAICGADKRAYAGSSNKADGNIFFFENFQNTDVGNATGKAAAEGQADRGSSLRLQRRRTPRKAASKGLHRPDYLAQTLHRNLTSPASPEPITT